MPVSKTQMANFQDGNMILIVYLFKKVGSVGPGISEKMLLASISTHLHLSKGIFNQSINQYDIFCHFCLVRCGHRSEGKSGADRKESGRIHQSSPTFDDQHYR